MSQNKHTPGPWIVEQYQGETNVISNCDRDRKDADVGVVFVLAGRIGGKIHGENFDDLSEIQANAHLIAAAPDLLEALEAVIKVADRNTAVFNRAKAATAKARGDHT